MQSGCGGMTLPTDATATSSDEGESEHEIKKKTKQVDSSTSHIK